VEDSHPGGRYHFEEYHCVNRQIRDGESFPFTAEASQLADAINQVRAQCRGRNL
jgi:hypothetical protein